MLFKNLTNLYNVKRTVKFSLLDLHIIEKNNIEKKDYLDIKFLIYLLDYEKQLSNIEDFSNQKLFQTQVEKEFLQKIMKESFQFIKNSICNQIYISTITTLKPSIRNKEYQNILKIESGKEISYFIPDYYGGDNYIPGEDFNLPKNSEIWTAIKIISKLIVDNNLLKEEKYKNLIENINKFNPNCESFFETETLNPYTVNRWKISEIKNNYKIIETEYKKEITKLNTFAKDKIIGQILEEKNLQKREGPFPYLQSKFDFIKQKLDDNLLQINHLILLINKFESYKTSLKGKVSIDIEKNVKELKKKLNQINKISSQLNGYKIHLVENFGIKHYSFLLKSEEYYFIGIKQEDNVSKFLDFLKDLSTGSDNLLYLDSMTWNGFKKLFLSKLSDIKFENGKNIKDISQKSVTTQLKCQ